MNPLISVVVPVYNVERFFDDFMKSLLNQTYRNIEVVLVDDGSTDGSGKMCEEYAKKDSRVVVYHKPNGGVSDARNFGAEHSSADLVAHVDPDDVMTEDCLEYLWYLMEKFDCKVSCASAVTVPEDNPVYKQRKDIVEAKLNTSEALKRVAYSCAVFPRLYQKELLLKNPFPVGKRSEDIATVYRIIADCDYVAFSNKYCYIYYHRKSGVSRGKLDKSAYDIFWATDSFYNFIEANYPENIPAVSGLCARSGVHFALSAFYSSKGSDRRKYFKEGRDYALKYAKNALKEDGLQRKLTIISLCMGYYPFKIFWLVHKLKFNT